MSLDPLRKKKPGQSCPWFRFSSYEIRGGRIIPTERARATRYSLLPRKEHTEDRRERNRNKAYVRLIQTVTDSLADKLDIDEDPEEEASTTPEGKVWKPIYSTPHPSPEIENRILQFSAEFGLLGLLHRRYSRIVEPVQPHAGERSYWQRGNCDVRTDSIWGRTLVVEKGWERYSLCIGASGGYEDTTFEAINHTYFGGLPLTAIPNPSSEEFFRIYGEPVGFWIEEAVRLATAIQRVDQNEITDLLRASWTDYTFGLSIATATFIAGSLLEGAALQFIDDYNAGFALRYCQNESCEGRLYYDNDPRSRFCSRKCASTQRQRDYREAQRHIKAARKRKKK
jgi:hypothetical protein